MTMLNLTFEPDWLLLTEYVSWCARALLSELLVQFYVFGFSADYRKRLIILFTFPIPLLFGNLVTILAQGK